jgi:restriction endonuclease Mrr
MNSREYLVIELLENFLKLSPENFGFSLEAF